MAAENHIRIAIVDENKCKPKKCNLECRKYCPVVKIGKLCVEVSAKDRIAFISEDLCIGCGICIKKCPFNAIQILNLPRDLNQEITHSYGRNSFRLHRLPTPRSGQVLGLVGANGTGKSTALRILANRMKPNLGRDDPSWEDILHYFRGSELQNYFTKMLQDEMIASFKLQHVELIRKEYKGKVEKYLGKIRDDLRETLELNHLVDRDLENLSGGELQRLCIGLASSKKADIYIYDEPSSFLDVKQRIIASRVIRSVADDKYVIVVEHDLAILDYLSDYICCLYGNPGAYGVVTMPFSVRDGVNIFMEGVIPTENLRFRDFPLSFKISNTEEEVERTNQEEYPELIIEYGDIFKLRIEPGNFSDAQITVLLGENGTGKTQFARLLAGIIKSNNGLTGLEGPVSYKPQLVTPKFEGTVAQLLSKKIGIMYNNAQFNTDVLIPLNI